MKLFISAASPYVRKCRIVVREKGLSAGVEDISAVPVESPADLVAANPLSQIPALIADDGTAFIDSPLICAWLDTQGTGPALIPPASTPDHWRVRRIEALGDGILEMTVKRVLEMRRPDSERSQTWLDRWGKNLIRAVEVAETADWRVEEFNLGTLTLAVAWTYLEFRFPEMIEGLHAPRLKALASRLEARDSFKATAPR